VRCVRCGAPTTSLRGTHRYTETGLSNVVLLNVETRTCATCGERELVTPRLHLLHHVIARELSRQPTLLAPEAVAFLRRWLGLTTPDFARLLGVRREAVQRWERVDSHSAMRPAEDRLLKLVVAQHDSTARYPLELFTMLPARSAAPIALVSPHWRAAEFERAARNPISS
jgi:putative zinc finger/helix-turn-helix YgiT family protein